MRSSSFGALVMTIGVCRMCPHRWSRVGSGLGGKGFLMYGLLFGSTPPTFIPCLEQFDRKGLTCAMQQSIPQHLRRVKLCNLTISKDQNPLAVDDGLQTLHFQRLGKLTFYQLALLSSLDEPQFGTSHPCPEPQARGS